MILSSIIIIIIIKRTARIVGVRERRQNAGNRRWDGLYLTCRYPQSRVFALGRQKPSPPSMVLDVVGVFENLVRRESDSNGRIVVRPRSPDYKSGAFGRSAIPPYQKPGDRAGSRTQLPRTASPVTDRSSTRSPVHLSPFGLRRLAAA